MLSLYEQIGVLIGIMMFLLFVSNYALKFLRKFKVKSTIVHFFDPPKDISVLEVGYFYDSKMHFRDVLAWLIDLKNRGFVKFKKEGGDVLIEKIKDFNSDLRIETEFWESLMRDKDTVSMRYILKNYNTLLLPLTFKFIEDLRTKNYFTEGKKRGVILGIISGLVLWIIGEIYLVDIHSGVLFIGLGIWGAFCTWASWSAPRMTDKGVDLYKKLAGFANYLKIAETDREKFRQELVTRKSELEEEINGVSNLEFSELLPYMIILNVDKQWYETMIPELKEFVKGEGEIISVYKG